MKKSLSLFILAMAVLGVALAFTVWDDEQAHAGSTCPSGTQKFIHMCIEKSARSAATYFDATRACGTFKRRLPTSAELAALADTGAVIGFDAQGNTNEWTGDVNSATTAMAMNGKLTFRSISQNTNVDFRCVA